MKTYSTVPVLYSITYSFKGWQSNKNHAFPSKRCMSNELGVGTGTKENVSNTYICMHILGAFGLLDFTMLRPVLIWRAVWNLWTVHLSNFPIFFRAAANRGYWISGHGGPTVQTQRHTNRITRKCCFEKSHFPKSSYETYCKVDKLMMTYLAWCARDFKGC
jgi:hypothetical protein